MKHGMFIHDYFTLKLAKLEAVLPDRVDDFQPKSSPKPAHFNKNQPKILTAKIMWYDFITMSIKINKDHFYLLKIK